MAFVESQKTLLYQRFFALTRKISPLITLPFSCGQKVEKSNMVDMPCRGSAKYVQIRSKTAENSANCGLFCRVLLLKTCRSSVDEGNILGLSPRCEQTGRGKICQVIPSKICLGFDFTHAFSRCFEQVSGWENRVWKSVWKLWKTELKIVCDFEFNKFYSKTGRLRRACGSDVKLVCRRKN